jgi:serine/threonine transporter
MYLRPVFNLVTRTPLVLQILVGLIAGILLALLWPTAASASGFLGELFIKALKAVAPILVFLLVISALADQTPGQPTHVRRVLLLYLVGTLSAAAVAVLASQIWPSTLHLDIPAAVGEPPEGILQVLRNLLLSLVDNPVNALLEANFIAILAWAVAIGVAVRHSNPSTREVFSGLAQAVSLVVKVVIGFAPLGVFGLVASTFADAGLRVLLEYVHLLAVLIGCMLFVALVINPLIVFSQIRRNPYPLVLLCLRDSGVTAFFTRSSAANIPVNIALSERLGLHEDTYSVSIPLGATVNMAGAAITVSVLSMAAAHTLGVALDLPSTLLLCIVASLAACGTSGVAGGSLLLVPLACSMFGISSDVAMQVVAIGFVVSVLQDSAETALNSSTDVLLTAAACMAAERRDGSD